jgi:hypothetical protein
MKKIDSGHNRGSHVGITLALAWYRINNTTIPQRANSRRDYKRLIPAYSDFHLKAALMDFSGSNKELSNAI